MKLREEASGLALGEIWPSLEEFVHFKCLALLMKGWRKWVTTLCGVGGSKIIVKQNLNILKQMLWNSAVLQHAFLECSEGLASR